MEEEVEDLEEEEVEVEVVDSEQVDSEEVEEDLEDFLLHHRCLLLDVDPVVEEDAGCNQVKDSNVLRLLIWMNRCSVSDLISYSFDVLMT